MGWKKTRNFVSPLEKPGPGVEVMLTRDKGRMGKPHGVSAGLLGWEGNMPGAAASLGRKVTACWVGGTVAPCLPCDR